MGQLVIKDVSFRYAPNHQPVLKNIHACFEKGRVYTIIGESGAGKSTLLSLISGLETCTDGQILYNGKDLREIDRDDYRAKSIGVVFQGYNLITNSTAVDNIVLSMHVSKSDIKGIKAKKDFAYGLLGKVGVDQETAERKVLKLSGGEQQRVGIARALSHNPDVIIADEPTGNLDGETEGAILDLFTKLAHNEDRCVIIVTHSETVTAIADEVWELCNGYLIQQKSQWG